MSPGDDPTERLDGDGRLPAARPVAFDLAWQRSRIAVYTLALPLVIAFRPTGFHRINVVPGLVLWAVACLGALAFMGLITRGLDRRLGVDLAWVSILCDAAFITLLISLDGAAGSLWFFLYLSNTAAAAFVAGTRAAAVAAVADSAAYLGLLVWEGVITGLDQDLWWAFGRLAILWGCSFYPVKGIADLRLRRLEIRRLREEDQRKLAELARLTVELNRRSAELAEKNAEVEAADRLKSRFLANMSHELRTPLNSIIGFTQILERKLADQIDPRHTRFLRNVRGSGQHLLSLINNLLDISKIEAGHMEFHLESVDPGEVVAEAVDLMHGVAEEAGVAVVVEVEDGLPPVVTDAHKLEQVLINLLSNAVKHSPSGGEVTVRAARLAADQGPLFAAGVRLDVVDRGPGIAPEHRDLIFEEFRQVETDRLKPSRGTGLGLALAKRYLEIQGGAIAVVSEVGAGSTFSALLPLVGSAPETTPRPVLAAAPEVAPADAPTVLVVEDDANAARLLADTLRGAGYRVALAANGDEALARAHDVRPALITLDLVMPGRDGWEVLARLKEDPATRSTPVVIVSVSGDSELGFALGADDFFVKPVEREALVARIGQLVEERSAGATRILVVDDDPAVHDLLAAHLEGGHYVLLSAHDGASGIATALRERPAVIVLDLMMPGMSGIEVADRLRADPRTHAIPIVVLSAHDVDGAERRALLGLVSDLQRKVPPWPERLLATVGELLGRGSGAE